jgi:hypothetical protein
MPLSWSAVYSTRSSSHRSSVLPVVCFLFALLVGLYVLAYTSPASLGPPVALAVRYLFFPLLGLGLALGAWSRFLPWGTARSRLQVLAWISFLAPVAAVIAYVEKSRYPVLYYEAVVLLLPFVLAAVGFVGAYRIATGRSVSKAKPATLMLCSVGMIGVGVIWSPRLLRDVFLPPRVVEGTIVGKLEEKRPRRAYSSMVTSYEVRIDGPTRVRKVKTQTFYESRPWYYVTRDVFSVLKVGDHIRAESSAGTDTLLSVQRY